ncbi:hypothetical protein [Nesterenkonia pannonica]|uniref:hypothetical protein n=1 Tax=Nesterenkonia pannonica TaxID=1548602 RepID=UPI0021644594|nr:hypothetical protein [Nesterenkonia pannonica]
MTIWGALPTEYSGSGPDAPTLADFPKDWSATIRLTYAATSPGSMTWLIERVR